MVTVDDLPFPVFENNVLGVVPEAGKLDELHLYHGSRCNRACAFCCVSGAPEGSHHPFSGEVLQAAVRLVARQGSLKIYGGEPTLDARNLRWGVTYLREMGFTGAITVFSNGLRPRVLTGLLDADSGIRVVLNYAILTGTGEKPPSAATLTCLKAYHCEHPGRLFVSHDFVVPLGRQLANRSLPPQKCYRCFPTLTSAGTFYACPFAVEYALPHYTLGSMGEPAATIQKRFSHFLCWIDETLEPQATAQYLSSCEVCTTFKSV